MMRFITEHVKLVSNPTYANWQACQTLGSAGALEQAVLMRCDRNRGNCVLTEGYTFASALETMAPKVIEVVRVKTDDQGILPDDTHDVLTDWDIPTGAIQGIERRRVIYAVCRKHNIIILEDEPPESLGSYLAGVVASFLSLDIDGRVLRVDSISNVLVPRSRMGWITASNQLWLKVYNTRHSKHLHRSLLEREEEIFQSALQRGALRTSGSWFRAESHTPPRKLFLHTTFVSATEDSMQSAF
ncbi:hypothetical protein TruAng_002361 [Truncatella angustata]|nr:hypothetical protein TruAng_002361 [Truncatella angustata]